MDIVHEKLKYVERIGTGMIFANLLILLIRECRNANKDAFFFGFSDIYLFNIILCVFVLKQAKFCIALTVIVIFALNMMNIMVKGGNEYLEGIVSSINGCMLTA